ncbi:MAG: efflux RND transporter periplasmic adaptor subunit [Marinibacterium sp.]
MMSAVIRVLAFVVAAVVGGIIVAYSMRDEDASLRASQGGHGSGSAASAYAGSPVRQVMSANVVEVTQMPAAERVRLGGYVEPRRVVTLTAQAPGRVSYVAGEAGERVDAGQVVVALDDEALQPQYRAAWANLSSEMSNIDNAQAQLYKQLYGPRTSSGMGGPAFDAYDQMSVPFYNMAQGFFGPVMPGTNAPIQSQQDAQHDWTAASSARAAYEQQLTRLAAAQSQLDKLDAQLRDRRAIAPWPGVILTKHVRVGDIVQPGQPLADFADVDQLDVRIEVPVTQVSNLNIGDQVPVTVNDTNLWAPVVQIFPSANEGQHTVTVKLGLPPGADAAPGMYVLAWIAQPGGGSPSQLAPAVPTTAIARRGSLPVAFVVKDDGTVEMRVLRVGDIQGSKQAVLSGLSVGERVVDNPSPHLKSGDSLYGQRP